MKFLVSKELQKNPLLKKLVIFVAFILALFLVSDILLHHFQIGLFFDKAIETILGNEEAFIDPLPFDSLLERVHINILTSLLTLMIIASVCISLGSKGILIHLAFISAILSHIALLSALSVGKIAIMIWITLFLLWHILAIMMTLAIMIRLFRR